MGEVYGKPIMTNLPPDLGKSIFEQILNSKPMSEEKRRAKVKAAIEKIKNAMNFLFSEKAVRG